MAYWKYALPFAREQAQKFALWKLLPPVVGAVISLRWKLQAVQQIVTTLLVAIASYLLLYALEFFWHLFVGAPVAIFVQQQKKISELSAAIQTLSTHPYDGAFEEMVRKKVQGASAPAQQLLRFLLDHGEMNIRHTEVANADATGRECHTLGFLDIREVRPGNGSVAIATYYTLKDNFRAVLKDIFYPRSS